MSQISVAFNRYRARHGIPSISITQRGGSYATIHGIRYFYYTQNDSYARQIYIGGKAPGERACVVLSIEPYTRVAELQTLERNDNCSVDGTTTAQDHIRIALFMAKRERVTRLKLTDESGKTIIRSDGVSATFDLSQMYFLATGKTWYEAYIQGLLPEDPILVGIWREYAHENTWDNVVAALRRRVGTVIVPVATDDIDTSAAGSAMTVFRRIKDAHTDFFARYNSYLPDATRIGPIKGSQWYVDL